ncbi:MAG: hypothetical protein ACXW3D_05565 [Caulobacteraceae bacterium]
MRKRTLAVATLCTLALVGAAQAAETITYTYDAQGRLIKAVHTGTVNNNVQVETWRDDAHNRTRVKVTGAP